MVDVSSDSRRGEIADYRRLPANDPILTRGGTAYESQLHNNLKKHVYTDGKHVFSYLVAKMICAPDICQTFAVWIASIEMDCLDTAL